MDLLQRKHAQILSGIGVGMKKWLSVHKTCNISETAEYRVKVTILTAYMKSYTSFRLSPNCMT